MNTTVQAQVSGPRGPVRPAGVREPGVRPFGDALSAGEGEGEALALWRIPLLWCDCHLFAMVCLATLVGHREHGVVHPAGWRRAPRQPALVREVGAGARRPHQACARDRVPPAMTLLGAHRQCPRPAPARCADGGVSG
ncbi:hypothetical protein [Streptomyces sp. NPDC058657]|uniref:hypothetical protein n=1 Tax=unclassified Streptomyces TaxID=2593676 RepID=UPI0036683376